MKSGGSGMGAGVASCFVKEMALIMATFVIRIVNEQKKLDF